MVLEVANRLNCSVHGVPGCKLLTFGFPYNFAEIERNGKSLTVFFASQSPAAFAYVAAIVVVYFVVFMAFFVYTLTHGLRRRSRSRSSRRPSRSVTKAARHLRRQLSRKLQFPLVSKSKMSSTSMVSFEQGSRTVQSKMLADERVNPYENIQYV